jgi:hypothetical protein
MLWRVFHADEMAQASYSALNSPAVPRLAAQCFDEREIGDQDHQREWENQRITEI